MEFAAALARLGQFAAAMVLAGGGAFFVYGFQPQAAAWPRRLLVGAAAVGAASTLGWLMAQAAALGDGVADAFDPAFVWSVAAETGFGRAAALRLGVFAVSAAWITLGPTRFRSAATLGGGACVSLAWSGHAAATEGAVGAVHLAADSLHLLAAAAWLGALAPLAVLSARAGDSLDARRTARHGLVAFSGVGPAAVGLLTLSGAVNSWFLVGPSRIADLPESPYGLLLLAKLSLFALMLILAAANRYALTPALDRGTGTGAIRASVAAETLLGLGVLACVAWLGTLPPPAAG